jgi:hypothetical protein
LTPENFPTAEHLLYDASDLTTRQLIPPVTVETLSFYTEVQVDVYFVNSIEADHIIEWLPNDGTIHELRRRVRAAFSNIADHVMYVSVLSCRAIKMPLHRDSSIPSQSVRFDIMPYKIPMSPHQFAKYLRKHHSTVVECRVWECDQSSSGSQTLGFREVGIDWTFERFLGNLRRVVLEVGDPVYVRIGGARERERAHRVNVGERIAGAIAGMTDVDRPIIILQMNRRSRNEDARV